MDATDRLKKRIDSLQAVIEQRVAPNQTNGEGDPSIHQRLKALRQAVTTPQLIINIVGETQPEVARLQAALAANETLLQTYKINAAPLPRLEAETQAQRTEAPTSSILKLQPTTGQPATASAQTQGHTAVYHLSQTSKQIIGRNPTGAQILLGDDLALVSGSHAEVQLIDGHWHLRDLESRNGTFLNGSGQRLQGWHPLQMGDRISLGSPAHTPNSASLIYEETATTPTIAPKSQFSAAPKPLETIESTCNCNILCVILNLAKPPSPTVQTFFQKTGNAKHITELVIVADPSSSAQGVSSTQSATQQTTQESQLQSTEHWLEQQTFSIPVNHKSLLSTASTSPATHTVIQPAANESTALPLFIEALIKLANRRFDKLLANRLKAETAALAALVEQQLTAQKASLQTAITQQSNASTVSLPPDFKETTREAQRKVSSDKDWFFRQVKNELMQAKTDILNDFKNSSITHKLNQFIGSMSTQVSNRKGFCYVRLHTPDGSIQVHEQTMALINGELATWVQKEWEKIATTHVHHGFRGLLEQSRETLQVVPSLTLPSTLFAPLPIIDPNQGLQSSLVAHETESRYPKQNIFSYLFKNLRGQLFGIVGLLSIVGGGFGILSGGRNTLMLIAAPVVIIFLCFAFLKEKKATQEKEEEKLKRDALAYYQSIAKDITDRQIRTITSALELEDRKFKEAIEQVSKVYASFANDAEQSHKQSATQRKEYQAQLNALEKDCLTLQRLQTGV